MLFCDDDRFIYLHKYSDKCHEIIKSNTPVLIFGAKQVGQRTLAELRDLGVTVEAFLDNKLHGSYVDGVIVKSPEEYVGTSLSVIAAAPSFHQQLLKNLDDLCIINVLPYIAFLSIEKASDNLEVRWFRIACGILEYEERCFKEGRLSKGLVLKYLDFVITEKCTLRCKDCSNLMQYFTSPQSSNYKELTTSFDRLYKAVDFINTVYVLGGEPFIEHKLADYLNFLNGYKNIGTIIILTNGTVLPSKVMIDAMKNLRVVVSVSNYKLANQKIDELKKILVENGIAVFELKFTQWNDCARIIKHNRTEDELRLIMQSCCVNDTVSIKNGKLWRCPMAGNIAALNVGSKEYWDYLDLFDENVEIEELRENIKAFIDLPYIKLCDWCEGRPVSGGKYIPVAEQMKGVRTLKKVFT